MRFSNYEFSPTLAATLATLLLFPALVSLGLWQLNRADEKRAIEHKIHEVQLKAPLEITKHGIEYSIEIKEKLLNQVYRHALLTGHYDSDHQFLLDNRTYQGKPGYHVLTPFILGVDGNDGQSAAKAVDTAVLVNRGWIPYMDFRDNIRDIKVDANARKIYGMIKAPGEAIVLDKEKQEGYEFPETIQSISIANMQKQLNYTLLSVIIELDAKEKDGFVREWQPYYGSIDRHIGYAIQWFLMALVLLALYAKYSFRQISYKDTE